MTFPTKIRSQYFELITNLLNQIPVQKNSDFLVISSALEIIFKPSCEEQIPPTLKDRFKNIRKIYQQPELYVEKKEHYEEFKKIVRDAVDWKIKQLNNLTKHEKIVYIEDQRKQEASRCNPQLMANHEPPDINAERLVIIAPVSVAEEQLNFQTDAGPLQRLVEAHPNPEFVNQLWHSLRSDPEFVNQFWHSLRSEEPEFPTYPDVLKQAIGTPP